MSTDRSRWSREELSRERDHLFNEADRNMDRAFLCFGVAVFLFFVVIPIVGMLG